MIKTEHVVYIHKERNIMKELLKKHKVKIIATITALLGAGSEMIIELLTHWIK